MGCSALAAAFGRHLGLPEPLLVDLASGALLLDIGKLLLPPELLARPAALNPIEMRQVQQHVSHALDLLDNAATVPAHVREMIATHHERVDGSGYPARLANDRIPLLGRFAAVIDSYHAMLSARPHRPAIAQQDALQELYRSRDRLYASEVVEQFLQCMSVYPVGSLVELTTGEVAIVMTQNAARRLMPRVMVLTTPERELLQHFTSRDLMSQRDSEDAIRIVGARTAADCGFDPVELFL